MACPQALEARFRTGAFLASNRHGVEAGPRDLIGLAKAVLGRGALVGGRTTALFRSRDLVHEAAALFEEELGCFGQRLLLVLGLRDAALEFADLAGGAGAALVPAL